MSQFDSYRLRQVSSGICCAASNERAREWLDFDSTNYPDWRLEARGRDDSWTVIG